MGLVDYRKKEQYSWIQYFKQRIHKNKNVLAILSGATGSGKSWSALSIGEMVDPEFNVDRVIFKGSELLKLINSGALKKGSCIVWDEAGVDLSNRAWQSTTNKLLNFLLQTFRHRNFILLFTTPYSDFIDRLTRKLFHAELRTISINEKTNRVKIKPLLMQYNSRMGKFYYKHLRLIVKKGEVVPVTFWNIPAPSKELIDAYESKRKRFTDELNKEIEQELNQLENKKVERLTKPLTDRQQEILDMISVGNVTTNDVIKRLNISREALYTTLDLIRKKGYEIKSIRGVGNKQLGYSIKQI